MLNIIAHRGWWIKPNEKNSKLAFARALDAGFGIETDFRDFNGELVISHDIPIKPEMSADQFFSLYKKSSSRGTIAINVKSDGLQELILKSIKEYSIENYFIFDASVPDLLSYIRTGAIVYSRRSEFEFNAVLEGKTRGVWTDQFESNDFKQDMFRSVDDKEVCIVSPELHNYEHLSYWKELREFLKTKSPKSNFSICTDFPEQAKEYFNV